jgi:plastocyanin
MQALRTIRISAAIVVGGGLTLMACAGGGDDADGADAPAGQVLQVASLDNLTFDPTGLTATAGEITIEHDAQGAVAHTFVIDEVDVRLVGDDAATFELEPGEYTFYCDVPGHQEAGMEGTLTVTG